MSTKIWLHTMGVLLLAVGCYFKVIATGNPVPTNDALRYITAAINLRDHQVLSMLEYDRDVVPVAGLLAGGPLIAVELAVAAADPGVSHTFVCALAKASNCDAQLAGLKWLRFVETLATFMFIWLLGSRIAGGAGAGWLACLIAFTCKDALHYTNLALAEPPHLLLCTATLYWLVRTGDEDGRPYHAVLLGFGLGAGVLIKPAVVVWIPLVAVLLVIRIASRTSFSIRPNRQSVSYSFIACGIASMLVGAWVFRNWQVAGVIALTDPTYLNAALAHRLAYNLMTWKEWAIGWVYYLPDFGDSFARDLFGRSATLPLGWGPDGFYVYGRDTLTVVAAEGRDGAAVRQYLLNTYVLSEPLKHLMVSLLLAFRGAFIGKYWGLAAWLLMIGSWRSLRLEARGAFVMVLLPPVALMLTQSLLSVSIARYNISLVPALSISTTLVILTVYRRLRGTPAPTS